MLDFGFKRIWRALQNCLFKMSKLTFNLDHVVIVVSSLEPAMEQFRGLGFSVSLGGNNGPTHNALIPFQDGTYIELISIRSGVMRGMFWFLSRTKLHYILKPIMSPLSFRLMCWLGGPTGIRDWCIKAEPLDSIVDSLCAHNIGMSAIKKFTRTKPNLELAEWFLVSPSDQRLPFFIQDITDTFIRIPSGNATNHSNGCIGISRLLLNAKVYSPMKEEIAVLNHQTSVSTICSNEKEVQLAGDLHGHIAIEMAGLESELKILEMKHSEKPMLR